MISERSSSKSVNSSNKSKPTSVGRNYIKKTVLLRNGGTPAGSIREMTRPNGIAKEKDEAEASM